VAAGAISSAALPAAAGDGIAKQAAKGDLRPAKLSVQVRQNGQTATVTKTMPFISSGTINAAQSVLGSTSVQDEKDIAADNTSTTDIGASASLGSGPGSLGCAQRDGKNEHGNVRVNQDCTFRRQAEENITYNPADPNNLLAGQNDSRVGFNQCGIDWSTDNGKHWGDLLPPFRQKLNNPAGEEPTAADPNRHTIQGGPGTIHTYDAGSDPALAFDSQGRAFFSCVGFDLASNASLLYVTASPAGANGSFFFNLSSFSRRYVVAEDNSAEIFHDKNWIAADRNPNSPNRDNVYVTWTVFKFSPSCGPQPNPTVEERYCSSPIFGSMSTDHARHWSTPEEISGTSDTLCFFGDFFDPTRSPHACNFDQGSNPTTLPNGDLEVIFNNGNTAATNPNGQQLGVHCHPTGNSAAGSAHLNCVEPSKVGNDVIVGEPQCNFGRGPEECIPGAYIRTNDFPRISINTQNNHLYATWQDYRNGEYDIQLSQSLDGGLTWHEAGTVNPDRGLDHYFPATEKALTADGQSDRVGDSYYRTERVPGENTTPAAGFAPGEPGVQRGNSDYVLAGGTDDQAPYDFKVLSPTFAPPDGAQIGFNGDYSGLTINNGTDAHPIWSDTRNANPYPENGVVHDEDVFTQNVGLPNGHEREGEAGQIGQR
jgi:hypothetical protein